MAEYAASDAKVLPYLLLAMLEGVDLKVVGGEGIKHMASQRTIKSGSVKHVI